MTEHPALPFAAPVTLENWGVRLESLTLTHSHALAAAAADGNLHKLRVTWVPNPAEVEEYIEQALTSQKQGQRYPFVVIDVSTDRIVGTTSFHDIVPSVRRLEIGYTWYAASVQRSHINTACKLLLMHHAFDTLQCAVVGWRTDLLNTRSQQAIARLGAHRDGVLRHHALRRDGTVRDTVMFSLLAAEWPAARDMLLKKMKQHALVEAQLQK